MYCPYYRKLSYNCQQNFMQRKMYGISVDYTMSVQKNRCGTTILFK